MIEGGCFCGAVRIAIEEGDYPSVNCHCTMCRRIHAAPYVTWLVVPADGFHCVSGAPEKLASSEKGARYFCSKCGSQVACVNDGHPEIVDVPVCCLDHPERFPPMSSIFAEKRLGWKEDI